MNSGPGQSLPKAVLDLPVVELAHDIGNALRIGDVLLHAEPGAGKSTGLPLALLLNAGLNGKIILLEPRRLAARSVAQRLATHLNESVGQRVGLRMRADTRVSSGTQLEVVTEGVLTRLLQADPSLDGVALVIFDEFHERSLHADLGLALCLEVQQALREDLRLLLMSASLNVEQIQSWSGQFKQFHCAVRQHQVETIWVGDGKDPLPQRIVNTVLTAVSNQPGDMLVFLPGVAEISRTARLLRPHLDSEITVHILHSGIALEAQLKATAPATLGCRRVILATSLAETSITIDGVRVVVDSGVERRGRYDPSTGAQRLETVMASQASAIQRAGRAGRTTSGVCYRLWSEAGHVRRSAHWQAEIARADLAPLLMELGLWGASRGDGLPWLEKPPAANLSRAEALLTRMGLWEVDQLTAHGLRVASLPVHPRLGHMLVWAARRGVGEQACKMAVLLEEQSRGTRSVDLELALKDGIAANTKRQVRQLMCALDKKVNNTNASTSTSTSTPKSSSMIGPSLAVVLAQAYPDWIAQLRPGQPGIFQLACGAGATLDSDDPLAHSPWIVVAQLGGSVAEARIYKAMHLDIEELEYFSAEHFNQIEYLDWEVKRQRVLAESRKSIGHLVVETRPMQNISDSQKSKALVAGIRRMGVHCLPWTEECREWQARVIRMQSLVVPGQVIHWPAVDDESLLARLEYWLMHWLPGIGSIKALQQLSLIKALQTMLDYQQQSLLDEWLPIRYTVPSGSQLKLRYTQTGNPVLSVRLQEMLGCADNPTIAKGRVPLKVELLSPARRPVQVTEDLANFWTSSYPAVKKDMAGRYPKHVWPDDPLSAAPTTHAKRRK